MYDTVLRIKDLGYSYHGGYVALRNINADIKQGERIAVIGSNGAGKSTFFLNLNGILNPDRGEIYFRDTLINKKNLNELRKNVGIVFQEADNQIIASTVFAEVSFGPLNLKMPHEEVKKCVNNAMEYMNITGLKDRAPHYLSGGEKKRVTIADIIAMNCEVIIFDEPESSLDPANTEMLEAALQRMSDEGRTLIISTHNMDFAYRWAERILVFFDGSIIADGVPNEIFGNDELIKRAGLKKPLLYRVGELLAEKGILPDRNYPVSIDEFEKKVGGMYENDEDSKKNY